MPFSQGALHNFRECLIEADLDRRLLERTIELAQETKAFDVRKLPNHLRAAIGSKSITGAGRVEDTINLLGHVTRDIARCDAILQDRNLEDLTMKFPFH